MKDFYVFVNITAYSFTFKIYRYFYEVMMFVIVTIELLRELDDWC